MLEYMNLGGEIQPPHVKCDGRIGRHTLSVTAIVAVTLKV